RQVPWPGGGWGACVRDPEEGGDGRRTGDEGVPYTCSEGGEAGVAARALPALPVTLISTASAWGQHFKIFTSELALDEATQEAILGKTSQKLWLGRDSR